MSECSSATGRVRTAASVPLAALFFAVLGGPAAWTAHLLASYPLVSVACRMGTTAPLNIITGATALIAAAAAGTGWWAYRRSREHEASETRGDGHAAETRGDGHASETRAGFMGLVGLLLGLLFTFAILIEGLPPLLQDPCVKGL